MFPDIQIFNIVLKWNFLFQSISVIYAAILYIALFKKSAINIGYGWHIKHFASIIIYGFIGAKVLAILEHILVNGYDTFTGITQTLLNGNGFRWPGFLAAILLYFYVLSKSSTQKGELLKSFDITMLTLAIVQIIGPFGCQFSGHGCYGVETSLFTGISYPYGISPTMELVHPTPIYRITCNIVVFLLLLYWYDKKPAPGKIGFSYIILASFFPIIIETITLNKRVWLSFSTSQLSYIALFIGTILFLKLKKIQTLSRHS